MLKGLYSKVTQSVNTPQAFLAFVASILIAGWGAWQWANANFISTASADVTHEEIIETGAAADEEISRTLDELTEKVEQGNALMRVHMGKHSLESATEQIERLESDLWHLNQFIRINGSDPQSDIRLHRLTTSLKEQELRRECILANNPLCD